MRNPNGFGTVYKMNGKHRRPWVARITVKFEDGIYHRKVIGYYLTKDEGINALVMNRINPNIEKLDITLKELYEEWRIVKDTTVLDGSSKNYNTAWNYIRKLETCKFKDIRTAQMQSIVNDCKRGRGVKKAIKTLLNMLFKYALENDIVVKNYAMFIKLPKEESTEMQIFTDLEIKTIEKSQVEWADVIMIMIYTGFRINEMLSVTKFNTDIVNWVFTWGSKTKAGKNRTIPINAKIRGIVKKWYDRDGETLICSHRGVKISSGDFRTRKYYVALEEMGVRKLKPHSTRHTCASLLAKAGANTISIQKIMGHTDYAMTANIYTHYPTEELQKAMDKI